MSLKGAADRDLVFISGIDAFHLALQDDLQHTWRFNPDNDDLGGGIEQLLFDLVIPLGAGEFWLGISRSAYAGHFAQSEVFIG